jgi:hypothetical protein
MLFRPERIIDLANIPEYFCHGPRNIELLPCDMVRMILCRDEPVQACGIIPLSVPVLALTLPAACMVWNFSASAQWAHARGLLLRPPIGPTELRPPRELMM